jgi:hypothetical protein
MNVGTLPQFKADVDTVTVDVAVIDNKGHFIPGIPKGNFPHPGRQRAAADFGLQRG